MSAHDNGGPAFPFEEKHTDGTHYHAHPGMTLRDYLAAKAMQAHVSAAWTNPGTSLTAWKEWKGKQPPTSEHTGFYDWIAFVSHEQADAMLAERAKVQP